jgi:hypothetical protein
MNKIPDRQQEILVPFAKDGTCFSPALRRPQAGTFTVGDSGNELIFADFDEALGYLQRMPTARWRRPSAAGNWGRVTAVLWDKLS